MDEHQHWKVLVVDDDEGIHSITRMVFRGYTFEDKPIQLLNASSAIQAQQILSQEPNIAVAILDVVMETDQAGLDLVNHIRNQLDNSDMRIILRTGHPGFAPEADVIIDYDINDYLSKAELSASRLLTSVVVALRSFRDLQLKSVKLPSITQPTIKSTMSEAGTLIGASSLSHQLHELLLPLKKDISSLLTLDHKPMARAIIDKIADNTQSVEQLCDLFTTASENAGNQLIDCEELLNIHSNLYLKRALEEGWVFDYQIQTAQLAKRQYDKRNMLLLLNCSMELAISFALKNAIILKVELIEQQVVFSFNSEKASTSCSPWQTLLKENLVSLSSLTGAKVIENSEHSVVRLLMS
jgi:CheY-like chemotaxis protein